MMAIVAMTVRRGRRALSRLALDTLVYFFAMHADFAWRFDAQPNLVALNTQHRDIDIVANNDGFADSPGQNKHSAYSPCPCY